jgi:hypothetical protein
MQVSQLEALAVLIGGGEIHNNPFDRSLEGTHSRPGRYEEKKNILLLSGIEDQPSSP